MGVTDSAAWRRVGLRMRVGSVLHAADLLPVPTMRPAILSGDKSARVELHRYVGLPSSEMHKIAAEKVRFYQRRQCLGEPFHHLLDAWQWVEKRHRANLNGPAGGGQNTGSSGAVPLSPDRAG